MLCSALPKTTYPHIQYIRIPPIDVVGYSQFIIASLNNYVETGHCLIVQSDGFILDATRWKDQFLQYDYIGAPWPEYVDLMPPGSGRMRLNKNSVGNGGFSLRSKKLLEITSRIDLDDLNFPLKSEDLVICHYLYDEMRAAGIRFAPPELAALFSIESDGIYAQSLTSVFGFHGKHWLETFRAGASAMQPSIRTTQQMLARAIAAHQAGNIAQAEFFYKQVLQVDEKQFDALHMLGVVEGQRGNFSAGLRRINEALCIRPDSPDAMINLARMQSELGDNTSAIAAYEKALVINPRSALAHNNLSIVLRRQRRLEEALAHCDKAVEIERNYADAWNNRGNVLFDLDRLSEALASYDCALALQPKLASAHLGRGNVLQLIMRPDEALTAYDKALAIKPNYAEAWYGRGMATGRLARPEESYASCAKAFAIMPDLPYAEGERLYAKMRICNWDNIESEGEKLVAAVGRGVRRSRPGPLLLTNASPAIQKKCAELYTANHFPASAQPLWPRERHRDGRIRLAYMSPDFRSHPVSYLTVGMFEAHDRSRFETTAVSLSPDVNDPMQLRLRAAFDRFLDVQMRTDSEIAEALAELEVDILVDLGGLTENARPGVLRRHAAPIQVNYLGYSGTVGMDCVDYIIGDCVVTPPEHAAFYTEKIVQLPGTYLVNDAQRAIAGLTPTRRECGLPEDAFVFCCFNNSAKIAPATFNVWMKLLKAVDNSVLWLSDTNAPARSNLCREAEKAGVQPQRLIFALRLPDMAEHLARQRQSDLFLDTLPYNAHTTASDALWAGVPVVTCLGTTFAGRVAASLLHAIGLPELVTESLQAYEMMALKIAGDPALRASLKDTLARNRASFPLFDTARFTRHIEKAYLTMWRLHLDGKPPQSFVVDP